MKLKSYFANTVEEAISMARREMGPDAMLVHSKRSGPEAKHLGAYEVVCATETGIRTVGEEPGAVHKRLATMPPAALPVDQLSREVAELKQQMERLARTLARSGGGMAGIASDPELSQAFASLTDAEVDAELVYEAVSRMTPPVSEDALKAELSRLVNVDASLGCPGAPARMVALAGPPGAGKTSCLVKLAAQYGVASKKPVQILTVDTYRIAAADELRSYAAILGIGCQVLETTAALAQALEEHRNKDLILIDTPGLCRNEMDGLEELARFLAAYPGMDTHLVLPASMRAADLKRIAGQYAIFQPRKLLFTRLDETETFGPILNQSVRMARPVSFFSHGQRIPEDLEAATADSLLGLILQSVPMPEARFGAAAA
jgi:flagellar biosynthesis protein FlhF